MAYQGTPPYQGVPASNPAQYSDWIHRVGAYLIEIGPVIVLEIIVGSIGSSILSLLFT